MRFTLSLLATFALFTLAGCTNGYGDIGAAQYNICCGTNCCCASLGSGGPIGPGDVNPANPCEVCDPSMSQTSWTPVADCDAGSGGTDAGPTPEDGGSMMGTDAGSMSGTDAGSMMMGTDAGSMSGTDAGSMAGTDAGSMMGGTDAGTGGGGGGCSTAPGAPMHGLALLALAAVGLVARRRR